MTNSLRGLSFGGHNVTLRIRSFQAPCLAVLVDGIKRGVIAFQPFEIELCDLRGAKELSVVVYGNRYNTFGHLHLDNDALNWCGPKCVEIGRLPKRVLSSLGICRLSSARLRVQTPSRQPIGKDI
jgi:hypothetical protein